MAERQISQPQGSDACPNQAFHFVADVVKHSADLAIDSLTQRNSQSRVSNRDEPRDLRTLAIEINSAQ